MHAQGLSCHEKEAWSQESGQSSDRLQTPVTNGAAASEDIVLGRGRELAHPGIEALPPDAARPEAYGEDPGAVFRFGGLSTVLSGVDRHAVVKPSFCEGIMAGMPRLSSDNYVISMVYIALSHEEHALNCHGPGKPVTIQVEA